MAAPADNCVLSSLMSNTTSWSLANDDAFLGALQDISQNLLSRTAQLLDKMDKLAHKVVSVQIKLDNANNYFLGLSNTKFIEARVYDDNDEVIKTEDVSDNKLQLSEEEIIVEAFKQGLEFVTSDFEKVQIENSDSESETEDEKTFYLLQPINKYHLRPLPAIIGTNEWFDDDKVGLADEVKDEAAQSESESEDENEVILKDEDKIEESDFSSDPESEVKSDEAETDEQDIPVTPRKVYLSDTVSEFSDDDELFKSKPTEGPAITAMVPQNKEAEHHVTENFDPEEEEIQPETVPLNFADELSSKLGLSVAPKLQYSDEKIDEDLTQSRSTDRVEEESKPRPKLLQKSTLFDSSDSDDDLFSGKTLLPIKHVKSNPTKKEKTKIEPSRTDKNNVLPVNDVNREKSLPPSVIIPRAKNNIFVDDTDDESDHEGPDIFVDLKVAKPKKADQDKKESSKGLFSFSDDSGSEADIFADIGGKPVNNSESKEEQTYSDKVAPKSSSSNDLFTDVGLSSHEDKNKEDPLTNNKNVEISKQLIETSPVSSQARKAPVGGVSMFGKGFNLGSLLRKKEKADSSDEAEDTADSKVDTTEKDDKEVEQSKAWKLESVNSRVLSINIGDMPSVKSKALDTVTRSRPKMNKGRRPPTRAGRKKVEDISMFTDIAEVKETRAQPTSAAEMICTEDVGVEPKREVVKAPIGGISLFGAFNPAEALSKKSNEKKENGLLGSINSSPDDFSDSPTVATSASKEEDKDEDGPLFTEPPPMDSKPTKDIVSKKDIFVDSDSDDELFVDLISKTGHKTNVPFSVKNSIFGFDEEDDDDDIFSDLKKN